VNLFHALFCGTSPLLRLEFSPFLGPHVPTVSLPCLRSDIKIGSGRSFRRFVSLFRAVCSLRSFLGEIVVGKSCPPFPPRLPTLCRQFACRLRTHTEEFPLRLLSRLSPPTVRRSPPFPGTPGVSYNGRPSRELNDSMSLVRPLYPFSLPDHQRKHTFPGFFFTFGFADHDAVRS